MSLKIITPPTVEPVTLQEARNFLRVDLLDDDNLISSLITSARQTCENKLRRAFITQTLRLRAERFPECAGDGWWTFNSQRHHRNTIVLPRPPVQSVTSITYVDTGGVQQTLDPAAYSLNADAEPGEVSLTNLINTWWPITSRTLHDNVAVTLISGYGDAAANVPEGIKNAIRMLVTHWYQNRMPVTAGTVTKIPDTITALLDPFRWGSYV